MAGRIELHHITKIEGHASLTLQVEGSKVQKCELASVEGSRYFEGIVKGRRFDEASEITSRICGICSCAHTIAAIMAVENASGVKPSEQTVFLRELLTIGERIRSHATHLYFLALPDYLGFESALAMLPKYAREVKRALRLMKVGNEIVKTIGGRDLHPVSATVGGFHKTPSPRGIAELKKALETHKGDAVETAEFFARLGVPDFKRKTSYLSLYDGKGYPLLLGRLKSGGLEFKQKDFGKFIKEYHEPFSTANFVVKEGKEYMTGALARMNNNYALLHPKARRIAEKAGRVFPSENPFDNNLAQALELVHYLERGIVLCEKLKNARHEEPAKVKHKRGWGISAIEVPRGILWHEYELDGKGFIKRANIVTPTAQNLRNMQSDIKFFLPYLLRKSLPKDKIVLEVEKLIRSYDPCFSCATHFLKVKWLK